MTVGGWLWTSNRTAKKSIAVQTKIASDAQIRQDERNKQFDELHNEHKERLNDHQGRFERMHVEFIPRNELQGQLKSMQDTLKSTDDWVRFLVKKEATEPKD